MSGNLHSLSQWQQSQQATALIGRDIESIALNSTEKLQQVSDRKFGHGLCAKVWQGDVASIAKKQPPQAEWIVLPAQLPSLDKPGLLLMDMDSTAIEIECIDEIARRGGVYQQVAEVTEQAMQGQLDFGQALRQRVAMLAGIPASVLADIAATLPLMPGLAELCQQLQQRGWRIAIASGGFNAIASVLAKQLQLDYFEANELASEGGVLSGELIGNIVDARRKAEILAELGERFDIPKSQWVAVGDGANDLPMLAAAQLGVGFHAKPTVAAKADVAINHLGLDAILGMLR